MEDEKIFLQKKRKCPDGENEEEIKEKEKEKLDEKILNKEEKPTQYNTGEINENELNISKSSLKTEKSNEKSRKRKKKSEMTRDELIMNEIKSNKNPKKLNEIIFQKGLKNFPKKKEYDFYLFYLIKYISSITDDFKDFKEDFTYYIYNNLRVLLLSKEINETLKKIVYKPENTKLFEEFLNFSNERWNKFIKSAEKYDISLLKEYKRSVDLEERKKKLNEKKDINNKTNNTENTSNINNTNNTNNTNNINNTNNSNNINNTNNSNNINNTNNTNNTNNSNNINNNENNSKENNITPNPDNTNNIKENNLQSNSTNSNTQNKEETNNINKEQEQEKFDINKAIEIYKNFPEENQLELFVAGIVYNSLLRNEKEIPKEVIMNEKGKEKEKNLTTPLIPTKIEIQNFNLPEMPMVSVISGFKFYTNIVEINLSGNALSPKSCFWLGSSFKTNPNISTLDISRCNIDNDRLYMFVEGSYYSDDKLNKEQFNLERLNLKDNNHINENVKNNSEHPLALILEKFKIKWMNLTNAKIGGIGTLKLIKKMEELLDKNKLFLENLILICNEFKNEECLSKLGDILLKEKCPLKNLILSKNLISIPSAENQPNYFKKFMEDIGKSKIRELFLINCEIGSNKDDIDILYDMLKNNKSLISIRLFGNKISNLESFTKILSIFSDYNKPLENSTLKSLDLSKNSCDIKVEEPFLRLIENLKLEYLDINQNNMEKKDKELFRERTNSLANIKIIY